MKQEKFNRINKYTTIAMTVTTALGAVAAILSENWAMLCWVVVCAMQLHNLWLKDQTIESYQRTVATYERIMYRGRQ